MLELRPVGFGGLQHVLVCQYSKPFVIRKRPRITLKLQCTFQTQIQTHVTQVYLEDNENECLTEVLTKLSVSDSM